MLDIMEVIKATKQGRHWVQWSDEDGIPVGSVIVRAATEDVLDFSYHFFGTANIEQGSGGYTLSLRKIRVNENWSKPMMCCPLLGCRCARVYYVRGSWACKTCHGLVSIVQRLDKVERLMVRRDALRAKLGAVRRTRRNEARVELDMRHLDVIERFLFDEGAKEPREQLRFRSAASWLEPDELPVSKIEPGTIGYGWEPGDRIGLRGLYPDKEQALVPARPATTPEATPTPGTAWASMVERARRVAAASSGQDPPPEEPKGQVPFVAPYIGTPTGRGWLG